MLVLAIETSHEPGSIALLKDGEIVEEIQLSADRRRGQSLVLEIQQLLGRNGSSPAQLNLVSVGVGPGSFTGLRVGIVAAKMIAYAAGASIAAIPTHRAIIENVPQGIDRATIAIDAQRNELFLQSYAREPIGSWRATSEIEIVPFDLWVEKLCLEDAVLGPGLGPFRDRLVGSCRLMDESTWMPRAVILGQLAASQQFQQTTWEVVPLYVRKSAAEETWDQKQQDGAQNRPKS